MLILRQPRLFDVDLLGPVVAGIISLGLWLGVIRPLDLRITGEQQAQQTLNQQNTDAQAQLEQMRQRGEALGVLAAMAQDHQYILCQNPGEDQVIAQLDVLSGRHNLQWNALTPIGYFDHPCFFRWDVQLHLTGPSTTVIGFLENLRREMPYCKTRELSITSHNTGKSQICNIDIKIDIFAPPVKGH